MASPVAPPALTDVPVTAIAPSAQVATPAARRAAAAPRPAARPAPVTAQAEPAPVAPEATSAPLDAPVVGENIAAAPVATGAPSTGTQVAEDTSTPIGTEGNGEVWGWMAALLAALGLGGGAIALNRTRTRKSEALMAEERVADAEYDRTLARSQDRPRAGFVTTQAAPAPAMASFVQPVVSQPDSATANLTQSKARPAARTMKDSADDIDEDRLEYLIAQRPNRDNPFKTRANRKRRALFLMRNGYGMQTAA